MEVWNPLSSLRTLAAGRQSVWPATATGPSPPRRALGLPLTFFDRPASSRQASDGPPHRGGRDRHAPLLFEGLAVLLEGQQVVVLLQLGWQPLFERRSLEAGTPW